MNSEFKRFGQASEITVQFQNTLATCKENNVVSRYDAGKYAPRKHLD